MTLLSSRMSFETMAFFSLTACEVIVFPIGASSRREKRSLMIARNSGSAPAEATGVIFIAAASTMPIQAILNSP